MRGLADGGRSGCSRGRFQRLVAALSGRVLVPVVRVGVGAAVARCCRGRWERDGPAPEAFLSPRRPTCINVLGS